MTGSTGAPAAAKPARKRPFPFGLVMLIFGIGLGFYGGVAATKRAMTAPGWVQQLFGIPPATVAPTVPPVAATAPTVPAAATTPAGAPPGPPSTSATGSGTTAPDTTSKPATSQDRHPADSRDLVGSWEVTDSLASDGAPSSSMTTAYVFRSDNTGEFDANGKKLYDFKWKPAGEDISVDFDGAGPDSTQPWTAKLKWSLNDDRTVLTLVPTTGKDPRSFVYSLGPGVYHKKA